ncbi:unnamed protein product, partial [Iphiclides podalirius]
MKSIIQNGSIHNDAMCRLCGRPTTAAVVITLQHDAVEKGVTYSDVLTKARQRLDLTALNIPAGLKIRQAATGARVLELPAGVTSEAADSFAAKLREVLAGEARIARPVKCADLRLTGLDDSVTRDQVLAAIVAAAACPLDHVKADEIREGRRGTGCIWVQCPVAATKVLVSARSMRIGWSYVHVESLEPRRMKCFRCLEIGHTRLQCTSEVDRSDICYRCSAPGHKATACLAKPHCAVCAVAGRPAEHSVGAKGCSPPKKGKKTGRTPASQQVDRDSSRQEEIGMQLVPAFPAMASTFPRWALAGLDVDLLKEAAIVESWSSPPPGTTDEQAMCFRSAITRVCDACMVRVRQRPQKRQVYWWSPDIADLRRRCVAARRKFQRQRRRRPRNEELNDHLQRAYNEAKKSLQLAILRAKDTACGELLAGLDRDPWGRPYRATRGKLGRGPPPAESISPERLDTVLEALFPAPTGVIPPVPEPETTEEVPLVSEGNKKKSQGPGQTRPVRRMTQDVGGYSVQEVTPF